MMKGKLFAAGAIFIALVIAGCSTNQAIEDKMPQLQPGQGLAAVVIDTGQDISQVSITPISGKGAPLLIPSAPAGKHLYLFVTQAGTYCMHHFNAGNHSFDEKSNDQCFAVDAGKISYGGVYTPFVGFNFSLTTVGAMSQDDDWDSFWKLLKSTYPNIAVRVAPATAETTDKKKPLSPSSATGICALISTAVASDLLGVDVGAGQEDDSLIPSCTYSHSEQQAVHISTVVKGDLNGGSMDALTPDHYYGWASFTTIPDLGDDARFTYRGSTYQLLVLKKKKFILLITIEGSQRTNLQDAMVHVAKTVISKL